MFEILIKIILSCVKIDHPSFCFIYKEWLFILGW